MKKKFRLIILVMLLAITGCTNKVSKIDTTHFDEVMNNRGFFVTDQTQTLDNDKVATAHVAYDSNYEINFIVCTSQEECKTMFSKNKEAILTNQENVEVEEEKDGKQYQIYKAFIGDRYYVLVQVEDTFLYVDVYRSYNYEIKNIIEELGY